MSLFGSSVAVSPWSTGAGSQVRSMSELAAGGSELSRTFDQPPLAFRLFLRRSGRIRHPIEHAPRQVGSLCREFAADPSSGVGPQRLLQQPVDGVGARLRAMLTLP